ncbi:Uncharacterised protein [Mycobacteroides abscessus subsp. abscessus]|nr:Uncharacterised protein [Mycobacteroides abscessus subsp. abscessus]
MDSWRELLCLAIRHREPPHGHALASSNHLLHDTTSPAPAPLTPVSVQLDPTCLHGLTTAEINAAGVPDWPTVYKRLLRITKNRTILAYNADYDRAVIANDCVRHGITRTRLASPKAWADVMVPRTEHAHSWRRLPNDGGHRALADVIQTRQHLLRMTAP